MPDQTDPQTPAQTVLLVEDDRGLRESLATVLEFHELAVLQCDSAEAAEALLTEHQPDLVVLDVNLPGRDGLELLRDLRSRGDARQVLLLTARHEVADRVMGLDAGADDYLPKPFALDELLARVRALLRRAEALSGTSRPPTSDPAHSATLSVGAALSVGATLSVGPVSIQQAARRVSVGGTEVELTKLEYDLLVLLVEHTDQVLTRDILHERVWGYDADYASNTLEVLVSSLRRKIEVGDAERVVHTVRGVGYVARA